MGLEKVIEILRDADIETVGCTGIEARIDNIDELAERIVKLFAIPDVRQQSELLKAYESMLFNAGDMTGKIKDQCRDDFIEAFNCA